MNSTWISSLTPVLMLCLTATITAAETPKQGDALSVTPKQLEKSFTVPVIPPPPPTLPEPWTPPARAPMEAAIRLNAAAKDVRLLEMWSLDPDFTVKDDKNHPSRLVRFHGFRTVGREEMKRPEDVQKLLNALILAIVHGPEQAMECFLPRHGLRIHGQNDFIDVLVCYECEQGRVHAGEDEIWFTTNKDAEPIFNEFFAKLGMRKNK
jgi:hypothetical protein